ncbi:MAG TPA: hypothetical protein DIU05_07550 [Bacteroidetes bacterium]|nr:hypothetical protein [Bacteroidota bacterium]
MSTRTAAEFLFITLSLKVTVFLVSATGSILVSLTNSLFMGVTANTSVSACITPMFVCTLKLPFSLFLLIVSGSIVCSFVLILSDDLSLRIFVEGNVLFERFWS